MGTRGYVALRFRGRYYIFYNQFDSNAEDLREEASVFGFPRRGLLSPFSQET